MTRDDYGQAYRLGFIRTVRFLASQGIPMEAARDFAQSAWAKGWEKQGQLRDDKMVLTWVNTIAMNEFRATLRKPAYVALRELRTTEPNWAAVDLGFVLRFCLPRERALLELHMRGLTPEEIARKEGVSPTAIRLRLLRARRRARWHVTRIVAHAGNRFCGLSPGT